MTHQAPSGPTRRSDAAGTAVPVPRGPVSAALVEALLAPVHPVPDGLARRFARGGGAIHDEDLQLVLFLCYELHYRGLRGVAADWEWEPSLLALRAAAERRFERDLREATSEAVVTADPRTVPDALRAMAGNPDGGLATYVRDSATLEQFREFVAHRSVYHLKEADPHTWAIPRLDGAAKAALVEIQIDEYGGGALPRMHCELFRRTMACLALDTDYGGYVDAVPAVTLAASNLVTYFGLHRRLRGALAGHLAAFEMTSSLPNRWYGDGLRRLGGGTEATRFYDEHVEADAVHEQVAADELCGSLVLAEPDLAPDVLFGAASCLLLDELFGAHLLDRWRRRHTSLRRPLETAT